jgi:hypothetical protein
MPVSILADQQFVSNIGAVWCLRSAQGRYYSQLPDILENLSLAPSDGTLGESPDVRLDRDSRTGEQPRVGTWLGSQNVQARAGYLLGLKSSNHRWFVYDCALGP